MIGTVQLQHIVGDAAVLCVLPDHTIGISIRWLKGDRIRSWRTIHLTQRHGFIVGTGKNIERDRSRDTKGQQGHTHRIYGSKITTCANRIAAAQGWPWNRKLNGAHIRCGLRAIGSVYIVGNACNGGTQVIQYQRQRNQGAVRIIDRIDAYRVGILTIGLPLCQCFISAVIDLIVVIAVKVIVVTACKHRCIIYICCRCGAGIRIKNIVY